MKLSEITAKDVAGHLKLDEDEFEDFEDMEGKLRPVMAAANGFILGYTGLSQEQADGKEDLYIAFMVLCQDMYDNRAYYVDKNNVNKVVETILGMHSINLL